MQEQHSEMEHIMDTPASLQVFQNHNSRRKKMLATQVGWLGQGYKAWVHRPVGGRPRFFTNPMLEGVTKTHW